MARQNLIIQVFLVSPSDVTDERVMLETVITELNQVWSRTLGLTFELLKWETNVHPAFANDPQQVINKQIGSDYDVLIGIFWGRLGSETPRADSGTVEEFELAYSKLQNTGGTTPEIMLYFKDAPIAPSKLDPKQLQGVQDFKKTLSSKGGLFYEFEDLAGFESSLRAHLSALAQQFSGKTFSTISHSVPVSKGDYAGFEEDEDYGYIDYVEIYQTKIAEMTMALEVINQATIRIGEHLAQHAKEFSTAGAQDAKTTRRIVKRAADDMNSYAGIMQMQISALSSARIIAFNALSNALSLLSDFAGEAEDLPELRETLLSTRTGITCARSGISGMREAAEALPRISKELNKAKRAMINQLDEFLAEIDSTQSIVSNIIEAIDKILT